MNLLLWLVTLFRARGAPTPDVRGTLISNVTVLTPAVSVRVLGVAPVVRSLAPEVTVRALGFTPSVREIRS